MIPDALKKIQELNFAAEEEEVYDEDFFNMVEEDDYYEEGEEFGLDVDDGADDEYHTEIDGFGGCKLEGIDEGGAIRADALEDLRVDGTVKIYSNMPEFEFDNVIFEPGAQLIIAGDIESVVFRDCGFTSDFALDLSAECELEIEGHCYFTDIEMVEETEEQEDESGWGLPVAALALATLAGSLGRKKVQVVKEKVEQEC